MKRKIVALLLIGIFWAAQGMTVSGEEIDPPNGNPKYEMTRIRCTCYWGDTETASGVKPYKWMLAGKREWIGKSCEMWSEKGSLKEAYLGVHEFTDTGAGIDTDGDGIGDSIRDGLSIDLYMDSKEDAEEWNRMYGDYVYIRLIDNTDRRQDCGSAASRKGDGRRNETTKAVR